MQAQRGGAIAYGFCGRSRIETPVPKRHLPQRGRAIAYGFYGRSRIETPVPKRHLPQRGEVEISGANALEISGGGQTR